MRAYVSLVGFLLVGTACSHVRHVYHAPQTVSPGQQEVKRVAVVSWTPVDHPGLEAVLETVASDYLNLRKTFLVEPSPSTVTARQGWQAGCQGRTEGVLFVRALSADVRGRAPAVAHMQLSAELFRCHDGALLFRSEGELAHKENDKALSQLRAHYVDSLGADKGAYVPCAFSLLQEMLAPLPGPSLTEAELEEKIELGAHVPALDVLESVARAAQRNERVEADAGA